MVKLSGKKYDIYKRKNLIRSGIVKQAKPDYFMYFIQYEYNNSRREEWFFVDNITCQIVQEQEQRLSKAIEATSSKKFSRTQNKAKKIKIGN